MTSNTAGPGVKHNSNSVTANRSNNLIDIGNYLTRPELRYATNSPSHKAARSGQKPLRCRPGAPLYLRVFMAKSDRIQANALLLCVITQARHLAVFSQPARVIECLLREIYFVIANP